MRDVPVDRMLKDLLQITDFSALDPARSQVSQALQDRIHRQAIDSIRQAVAYDRELQLIVKATSADQLRFDRPDFLKSMDQYTSVSRGVSQRHHVIELGFDLGNMHGAPDDVVANAFVAAVIDDQVTLKRIMVTCLSSTQVTTVPIQPHSGESNGNVSNNVIEATWRQVDNKD
ncbi:hypothetical protein H4R35_007650 [Dimargaris xerosporica]|nr:hypothetical protein H4R35_007650 [Dimargaris xerosporica]